MVSGLVLTARVHHDQARRRGQVAAGVKAGSTESLRLQEFCEAESTIRSTSPGCAPRATRMPNLPAKIASSSVVKRRDATCSPMDAASAAKLETGSPESSAWTAAGAPRAPGHSI